MPTFVHEFPGPLKVLLVRAGRSQAKLRLEVPIEVLVGVERRRIGREEKELNLQLVLLGPGLNKSGVVDFGVVANDEKLPACRPCVGDQAVQEADEVVGRHRLALEEKEAFALIVDG
ncbi:MAG: hypothetical protein Q3Y13_08415 [Sutterella sp.]|nr:hypothetical protein [Sutterella sp.]